MRLVSSQIPVAREVEEKRVMGTFSQLPKELSQMSRMCADLTRPILGWEKERRAVRRLVDGGVVGSTIT